MIVDDSGDIQRIKCWLADVLDGKMVRNGQFQVWISSLKKQLDGGAVKE